MSQNLFQRLFAKPRKLTTKELIRHEAKIGKQLFGPVPKGHDREFFYLGNHTWVWHETWRDARGRKISVSTHYEVHNDRIIKIQDGQPNRVLDQDEARRLREAVQWYYHLVTKHIYGRA